MGVWLGLAFWDHSVSTWVKFQGPGAAIVGLPIAERFLLLCELRALPQAWVGADVSVAINFMATRGQSQPTFPLFLKSRALARRGDGVGVPILVPGWGSMCWECRCLFCCLSGLGSPRA